MKRLSILILAVAAAAPALAGVSQEGGQHNQSQEG